MAISDGGCACHDNEIDHDRTEEIVCPYCGYEFSESWEAHIDDGEKIDCNECDKTFTVFEEVEVYYTTDKIKES